MKKKTWFKLSLVAVGALLIALAGAMTVGAKDNPAAAAGYVGSKACYGCHTGTYNVWANTGHAHMITETLTPDTYPAPVESATPTQQAELNKALFIVAGQRFVGKDSKGNMVYLNVQYDTAAQKYVDYKGGTDWSKNCAGCHTTGQMAKQSLATLEKGIGCESCHGPGAAHIAGKGDPTKITVNYGAETCGQCHNGGAQADGNRWPEGFKPGMHLSDVNFKLNPIDPNLPPEQSNVYRQMAAFLSSKHSADHALVDLNASDHANANCYACHSAEALRAKNAGKPITDMATLKKLDDGVSCVACHSPHSNKRGSTQLATDEKNVCTQCHNGSIPAGQTAKPGSALHHNTAEMFQGFGAPGVAPTQDFHQKADLTCQDCHMTGGQHAFKVLTPEMTAGTDRRDSCTACHTDSSPEIRGAYVEMWQSTTKSKIAELNSMLGIAQKMVKANPKMDQKLVDMVNTASTDISFVVNDGSNGAHNFSYATKILANAEKLLTDFSKAAK